MANSASLVILVRLDRSSRWRLLVFPLKVAGDGILVNAVCPGPIDGPRMDAIIEAKARTTGGSPEEIRTQLQNETLLGRLIPAEHIGEMVAFLASERAASITGQTLDVNAGYRV